MNTLLEKLNACRISHDPQALYNDNDNMPEKVAFVPLSLFNELKEAIKAQCPQ